MLKTGVGFSVPVRGLLLLGSLILLPAWAQASDASFAGDSSCTDPPIFSDIFSLPPVNATGGLCRAFGNHTGHNLNSLSFTTSYPVRNPDFFCAGDSFFTNCDFNVDGMIFHSGDTPPTVGTTLTLEFFGFNADHRGIPVDTVTDPLDPRYYNFYINLNSRVCNATTGVCSQPTGASGSGDWIPGSTIGAVANAPEPGTWMLLLGGLCLLLARARLARNPPAAN
jgi:hypothetical protein